VAAPYEQGIYAAKWTERTYMNLLARAEKLLQRGESVVLDASWNQARHRELARDVAVRTRSTLVALRCETEPEVAAARLRQRAHSLSDADEHIAAAMGVRAEPWPDASTIHTDAAPADSVARAAALVRRRPC
jgi:predicted kinase